MNPDIRLLSTAIRLEPNDRAALMAYIPGFLSPQECRQVVELAAGCPEHEGLVGSDGDKASIRKSNIRIILPRPENEWLFAKIEAAALHLNKEYKYDLKGFYEGMQFATYERDGHYGWHSDFGRGVYSVRKLSLAIQLSDPSEYEGGEFEFMASKEPAPKEIGSLIAFPSFLVHRVCPVTRGKRMSLVSWISGPAFR